MAPLMKKIFLMAFVVLTGLTACEKTPVNGALDGMWQLMEVSAKDVAAEDGWAQPQSVKGEGIYWNVQLDLLVIHSQHAPLNGYTFDTAARFRHEGGRLDITEMYVHYENRDSLITDPATTIFEPLHIHSNRASYAVEKLTGKQLILCSDYNRLVFRKF